MFCSLSRECPTLARQAAPSVQPHRLGKQTGGRTHNKLSLQATAISLRFQSLDQAKLAKDDRITVGPGRATGELESNVHSGSAYAPGRRRGRGDWAAATGHDQWHNSEWTVNATWRGE